MRYKNEDKDLKLYAVAGTQTVLLSFDIDKSKLDNKQFLGFSVERKDEKGKVKLLNGSKHFASLANNADEQVRNRSLVQSFYWQDYTADPEQTYTYTIKPMFGSAADPHQQYENSIPVTTEKLHDGKHSVFFNYGVTGSQAYTKNKEYGNRPLNQLKGKVLEDALAFLGRDLWSEGLLKFVQQAKNKNFSIYGAFYEFQYEPFLKELKAVKNKGADVQLVVSGKEDQYEDREDKRTGILKKGNHSMIKKTGLSTCIKTLRTKPSQPHNKFMVLCEKGKAKQVWTGSTNITLAGIFGQCNTGHWIVDDDIAEKYLQYWKGLIGDPTMGKMAKVCEAIQRDTNLINLPKGDYVFFSPRDTSSKVKPSVHLENYAELIDNADELVCMVFPFNMDDVFAKVYAKDKKYLRLLIFESASDAASVKSNDIDLKVTGGSVYQGKEKEWVKELTTKSITGAGILYVHNKFFILDALTDHPVVLTGSANFSNNSIRNNDENSVLIKGNARVTDIYLTEFDRLFTHFWPRYLEKLKLKNKAPEGFEKPLDETYIWHNDYFNDQKFRAKRKKLFENMYGAKKV
jgi:phosphatidylserine/phosphatidylglycerophosphate/cardiolipin synthase-like enzyme